MITMHVIPKRIKYKLEKLRVDRRLSFFRHLYTTQRYLPFIFRINCIRLRQIITKSFRK